MWAGGRAAGGSGQCVWAPWSAIMCLVQGAALQSSSTRCIDPQRKRTLPTHDSSTMLAAAPHTPSLRAITQPHRQHSLQASLPRHSAQAARLALARCADAHLTRTRARLAQVRAAASAVDTDASVGLLKQAVAKPGSVPAPVVLDAMLNLEAQKLPTDGWLETLQAPGTHWRLIFTADEKQVQAAKKKQPNKGGIYFPLAACQKFDRATQDFENGVFLGPVASLTFNGPFRMAGRQLSFDVVSMNVGLGPWRFSIPFKKQLQAIADMAPQDVKKLPFFLYAYIDKDIVVARGRSGGLAVWQRAAQEWEARAGVLAVYK